MAMPQEEVQKAQQQVAAGEEGQGMPWRVTFDPFGLILQQLNKLDGKVDELGKDIT